MVGGIVAGRASSGAESEAQSAWGIQGDQIPVAMLGIEQRVINAPDSSGSGTNPIMAYVFGAGIAQVANIGLPMIPSGQAVFPSFTSALPATRPAAGAVNTDQDPGMRGQLLTPQKVQANTSINVEDRGLYPGLGQAVAAHLADAVAAGLDLQALLDNNGFLDETSSPLTPPADPGSATTWAEYSKMLTDGIDGKFAMTYADVRLILGQETFSDADIIYRNNNSNESVVERISRLGNITVSARIPDAASNVQDILRVKGTQQGVVQPLWPGITIEDIYSSSKEGQIRFTATALAAFSVQQPSQYSWLKANVS